MSVKEAKAGATNDLPSRFADLTMMLPPHVIRNESDYVKAIAFVDRLLARPKLSKGQTEFFETWSVLIAAYESQRHAIDANGMDGLKALKHLVEENGMTASDLGLLLGNRSLGSKVLRGERELSKSHLRILAERFKVEAGLFL